MNRAARCVAALALSLLTAWPAGPARAATTCPALAGETIRWLVPSRPGGGYDAYVRLLQPFIEQALEVRVRIENRPEAAGRFAAQLLRDARPDGRTLGSLNGVGLLSARLLAPESSPDPMADFRLLGRIGRNHIVLYSNPRSGITSIEELVTRSERQVIVAPASELGGSAFLLQPVTSHLLGIDIELVAGYDGTPARVLALARGEVDILFAGRDTVIGQERNGELLPLLQINQALEAPLAVPLLTGADGLAARRALATGRDPVAAAQAAAELASIAEVGRLLAAPPGIEPGLAACLESALGQVITGPQLQQAADRAGLTIAYADSETTGAIITQAQLAITRFEMLIRAQLR